MGALSVVLLLAREPEAGNLGRLVLEWAGGARRQPTGLADPGLEALRAGNPTGRSLPLLHALALGVSGTVVLDFLGGSTLSVAVSPA
jgi:hypothetical protein